ncbi:hypothetical protein Hypma_004538 [Hypsizygus marmoreus]|uniref:Uncharacterized protein n=1 Tax=Hypsizygus marmoreus TaxID=39966 RepID=A0A369JY21_HYPMA|nr:hypothetical protein Hypma_004538 [Hypsizygus marmoreus]
MHVFLPLSLATPDTTAEKEFSAVARSFLSTTTKCSAGEESPDVTTMSHHPAVSHRSTHFHSSYTLPPARPAV